MPTNPSRWLTLLPLAALLILSSCQPDELVSPDLKEEDLIPVSASLSFFPTQGAEGTYMAVTGTEFSVTTNFNKVTFPNAEGGSTTVEAVRYSEDKDSIWVVVPPDVISGPLTVSVQSTKSRTKEPFTIVSPAPGLQLSPKAASDNMIIALYGIPFSEKLEENAVSFVHDGTSHFYNPGQVIKLDIERQMLWVRVPGATGSGSVVATVRGLTYASKEALEIVDCNASTIAGGVNGYADGYGSTAQFNYISGMISGPDGMVYVVEAGNHLIRKLNPETGQVTIIAGSGSGYVDGPGTEAKFYSPEGITLGSDGLLYVADKYNHRIRSIDPQSGEVKTVAGTGSQGAQDGIGTAASLNGPEGITSASDGMLYFSDNQNYLIRKFNPASGEVSTIAGNGTGEATDGPAATAVFGSPSHLTADGDSVLYIVDRAGYPSIRKLDLKRMEVKTFVEGENLFSFAGTDKAFLDNPTDVRVDVEKRILYFTDSKPLDLGQLKAIDLNSGVVTPMNGYFSNSYEKSACSSVYYNILGNLCILPDGSILASDMVEAVSNDYTYIQKLQ